MPTTGIGTLLSSWFYLVISTYWTEIFAMFMGILLYKIASYVVVNSTAGLPFVNCFKHRLGRKSARLPILPPFWPNDPKGYFSACETLLEASRIKDEGLRYNALLNALTKSPDTLKKVHDMLPATNVKAPYTELKRKLIERFSTTGKQCLSGLLSNCRRGDLTAVGYLAQLRTTLGGHYGGSTLQDDLLRHCLLASVDSTTQKLLKLHDSLSVDELARQADKLTQTDLHTSDHQLHTHTQNHAPPQQLINEMLDSRITALQHSLSHSPANSPQHTVTKTTFSTTSPRFGFPTFQSTPVLQNNFGNPSGPQFGHRGMCRFHSRYGNRAFKCEGNPCSMYSDWRSRQGTPTNFNRPEN